jgi:3-mercaptopyruvate sulfurtransferase SseA
VALQLKRRGITRVHPLEGGLTAWMARQFPVRAVEPPATAPTAAAEGPAAG